MERIEDGDVTLCERDEDSMYSEEAEEEEEEEDRIGLLRVL